jgi:hypothetical protein
MNPMFKVFTGVLTKALGDDGRRLVRTTASSSVEDLHGDIIEESAILDMVNQVNGSGLGIFLNHSYNLPEDLFGTAYQAAAIRRQDGGGLAVVDMDVEIEVNEANPRAIQMWDALPEPGKKRGMKVGTSIGANVKDWEYRDTKRGRDSGYRIKGLLLLEASIVGIPANPRSWVQLAKDALTQIDLEKDAIEFDPKSGVLDVTALDAASEERLLEMTKEQCACGHGVGCTCSDCDCTETMHSNGADTEPSDLIASVESKEEDEIVDVGLGDDWEQEHEPEIDLAILSDATPEKVAESHPELPDAAFACIDAKGRHYPHHTSSGAVNKSLLRNALARIADSSNTQCGKAHLEAHASALGIGDRKEEVPAVMADAIPDLAEETTPEVDLEATIESVKSLVEADDRDILVSTVVNVLEHASKQLSATRLEADVLKGQVQSLTAERDELRRDFELAAEIIDGIARQPLVKKTKYVEESLNSVRTKYGSYGFSDGFISILERNPNG